MCRWMSRLRYTFKPDVNFGDAEMEMYQGGLGTDSSNPLDVSSDSSTFSRAPPSKRQRLVSMRLDQKHSAREKQQKLREEIKARRRESANTQPTFEDFVNELNTKNAYEYLRWVKPTPASTRKDRRMIEPSSTAKDVCKPIQFQCEMEKLHKCCLSECDRPAYEIFFNERLQFWRPSLPGESSLRMRQYERVLADYNKFWNYKTESVDMMVQNWPVCLSCYKGIFGLSDHRWKIVESAWKENKGHISRIESLSSISVRPSPVSDFFNRWLRERADVRSLLLKILAPKM